jgi:hypothetical protein
LRGQARRRRAIIIVPYPPPRTMHPPPPLLMRTLAAIGGKVFAACSWVDLTLVHTHPTPRQRQRRRYDDEGNAGTRDGNNIKDGGSNSGRWTARRATGAGVGEVEIVTMSVVSGDDALGGGADDAMRAGGRQHDDRGRQTTATSDNC